MAGAPLNLALNGSTSTGNTIDYTVSVSNSSLSNSAVLTTTIPQNNPSLQLQVDYEGNPDIETDDIHGTITLQLFEDLAPKTVENILTLVKNKSFYDGLTFHRIVSNFMIQGGDPNGDGTGGPGYSIDDEFKPCLAVHPVPAFWQWPTVVPTPTARSSSSQLHHSAMAISAIPSSGSLQKEATFLIRSGMYLPTPNRSIRLTLIRRIHTMKKAYPDYSVVITDATSPPSDHNGVLRLSVPNGTTGSADVTVTATDSVTNETTSRMFHVTVSADTNNNDRPFLGTINPITTTANTPVSFDIPATDVEGDAKYFAGVLAVSTSNLSINVNSSTGHTTVTPNNNVPGVYMIRVGVTKADYSDTYDAQYVPVYVDPAAPTSISLLSESDTGSSPSDRVTNLNNTSGKTLKFQVNGVVSGALVQLFANGTVIGSATATGTTVTITTNGTATLGEGANSITAKQTLKDQKVGYNGEDKIGNLQTTVDLASVASSALSITVDTAVPQFDFTPATNATVAIPYTTLAATQPDTSSALTYSLTQSPTGMTINAATGPDSMDARRDTTGNRRRDRSGHRLGGQLGLASLLANRQGGRGNLGRNHRDEWNDVPRQWPVDNRTGCCRSRPHEPQRNDHDPQRRWSDPQLDHPVFRHFALHRKRPRFKHLGCRGIDNVHHNIEDECRVDGRIRNGIDRQQRWRQRRRRREPVYPSPCRAKS